MKTNNHFLNAIIDMFEDFLDDKNVRIPNPERDAEDIDNTANIYGDDYDEMMEDLREICRNFGIDAEDNWEETRFDMVDLKGEPIANEDSLEKKIQNYCAAIKWTYYSEMLEIAVFLKDKNKEVYEKTGKEWFLGRALIPFAVEAFAVLQHNVDSYGCDWDWVYSGDGMDDILYCQRQFEEDWLYDRGAFSDKIYDIIDSL